MSGARVYSISCLVSTETGGSKGDGMQGERGDRGVRGDKGEGDWGDARDRGEEQWEGENIDKGEVSEGEGDMSEGEGGMRGGVECLLALMS